jgi:hypothetical protein
MKLLFLFLLVSTISYSQTLSFAPTYHVGSYGLGTTEEGKMKPTFDWSVGLYVPVTEKFAVTPSVYYYFALYEDRMFETVSDNLDYYETFWYFSLTFEYTFSEEPLFK